MHGMQHLLTGSDQLSIRVISEALVSEQFRLSLVSRNADVAPFESYGAL